MRKSILIMVLVALGLALSIQGGAGSGALAGEEGATCTALVYLQSFGVVRQGTRPAGNNWILTATVNDSVIAEWHYDDSFTQTPSFLAFSDPAIQLSIKATAKDEDENPDIGSNEGSIELQCPMSADPLIETLEVRVEEYRGPSGGTVHFYYTTWQFEFLVVPLSVRYHQ